MSSAPEGQRKTTDMIGKTISHYKVGEKLGEGGMGAVYRAQDTTLKRDVALKVLPTEFIQDQERLARFEREAQVLASLSHPNIAVIYGLEQFEDIRFLVLELVDGETLAERLRKGAMPAQEALAAACQIAEALEAAHEKGIVHRDLKPGNVMFSGRDRVKVLDFGLAKPLAQTDLADSGATTGEVVGLSTTGAVIGTPAYMSPEQIRGTSVDTSSDIFSFGIVFHEMLTGQHPFQRNSTAETMAAILRDPPMSRSEKDREQSSYAILDRLLEKEPADRYGTIEEVCLEVRRLRDETSGWTRADETTVPADTQLRVRRTPFVGRTAERAELERLIDSTVRGRGGMILIGGEPGVGKTRLVEEVLDMSQRRRCLSLTGRCYEMEGTPPFMPFVETVELCARVVPPAALREVLGDAAPEVARLVPDLRRLFPDIPAPIELPPEQQRHYLFKNFAEFLERASRVRALVVLLDDLQWADDATLQLLQHLAPQLAEMPILVLGTYRDVELDVHRPFAKVLETLTRKRVAQRLNLQRLPQEGVKEMLAGLGGPSPPVTLVEGVYRETEGNPFFVEEVFHHLKEEEALFGADGQWRSDLDLEQLNVPEGVRLVIGRRLERVSQESQRVLTLGAIVGRSFSLNLLEAIGDVTGEALLTALEEAEGSLLIVPVSEREPRWEFSHALIRQTLVESLSLPRRQRLHLQVAEAIEREAGDAADKHASDLAHHLYQAGVAADHKKTIHFMMVAGERRLEAGAFEESLRHFDRALNLLEEDDSAARAALLVSRGRALLILGRTEQAFDAWQTAASQYESLGDVDGMGRVCLDIALEAVSRGENQKVIRVFRRGLSIVGEAPSAARSRLLVAAGSCLAADGDCEEAPQMLRDAVTVAEQLGDPGLLSEVLGQKVFCAWSFMAAREWAQDGRRACELLRSAGDLWNWVHATAAGKIGLVFAGQLEEAADADLEECEKVAARLGYERAEAWARVSRGLRELVQTGDIDAFEVFARWYRDWCQRVDYPWDFVAYSHLGLCQFWRGHWEDAPENFEISLRIDRERPTPFFPWGNYFMVLAYAGDPRALRLFEERRSTMPRPRPVNHCGSWVALMRVIEGFAMLGRREEAAELYPLAKAAIETGTVIEFFSTQMPQIPAGIAAACGEQWDAAEQHYQTALRQSQELPHKMAQPEVRRWYSRMLIDRAAPGDLDKARTLLAEAKDMYQRIGMPRHVEMTQKMAKEI